MNSTKLMEMLFSDQTPDENKDQVSNKITEAINSGASELKSGDQNLTLTKEGEDLVKIQDNKSGESTLAKCNPEGGFDLVPENEVNQKNKTFSDMELNNTIEKDLMFSESEVEEALEEVKYFSDLENGIDRVFSDIEDLVESDYTYSDIEDAYEELEVLYSELTDLYDMGYEVEDAIDNTVAYSEALIELAEQELFFSEAAGELVAAADDVRDSVAELIEHPTDENKDEVQEKVEELHDAAKEYSDVFEMDELINELACYSELADEILTFSDVEDLKSDVDDLHEAVHDDDSELHDDDEVTHKVKALCEEARAYAEVAEDQGHDVSEVNKKLDEIEAKLDEVKEDKDQAKEGSKSFSNVTYIDSFLDTPII